MKHFNNILVVLDSTQETHCELERALKLVDPSQARLHLIDVVKNASFTVRLLSREYEHVHESLVKEKQEAIGKLVDKCKSQGIEASGEVLAGVSSQRTIEVAQRIQADLIIRAGKGARSLETGNLGRSSQKLVRRLPCAVWLANPAHELQCKTIVATVDASPGDEAHAQLNRQILSVARELSHKEGSRLLVCYVWSVYGTEMLRHRLPPNEFERLLEHNRQQHNQSFEVLLAEFGMHANGPDAQMLEGEPSTAIPAFCEQAQADLLICGTVSRHGLPGLLIGNTAERIVNRVDCSILAVVPSANLAQPDL